MSKKFEAIKKAVFYSEQKPELLANLLVDSIDDKATSVAIEGDDSINIPASDSATATYTASVLSQFGDAMDGEATLALDGTVTGVSISDNTVTVASTVTAESFTLKATSGSLTATKTVKLVAAE